MHKELPSKEAPCTNAKSRLRGCIVRLKRPISFAERHANEDALRNIPRRVSVSMFSAKALVGLRREHLKWEARLYMLFNSVAFAIFLPIVFTLYWMLNDNFRVQNLLLLIASYLFYGWWDWRFLFLIAACSGVNFIAGRLIYQSKSSWVRHTCLVTCCVVCLGALCVFKYYDFFIESFSELLSLINIHWSPWVLNLALPVGISFFTFQALSYTIDIALKKMTPTRDWIEFFTFIAFFPQLVAGPIERATHLLPQFQRARVFNLDAAIHGVSLITYGLFKKIVVADTLSPYVDRLYADPLFYSSTTCVLGAIFFSFQIYCDFSGYSDVARGIGRLLGFDLMLNFDRPYLAKTFSDFWRRWHISLSSWFRDYVYIPLGGSRVSLPRLIGNLWV
ncbi:MAG: MBOAT family O-acyltransferase, partial [Planctomycetia bacterium]|nr:MBOAT family O-acyltransferase [Planctomycetia bacterium]